MARVPFLLNVPVVPLSRQRSRGRVFRYAHQLQAKIAYQVEDAVQVSLIADLADEDGQLPARFQGQPLEGRPEALSQAAPDGDPVPGRLHVPSRAAWTAPTLAPKRGGRASPEAFFTQVNAQAGI